MSRIQPPSLSGASLNRRNLLAGSLALAVGACEAPMRTTTSHTPKLAMEDLSAAASGIAQRVAPGVLGAGLMNIDSGEVWTFNGERPFPMQSVFKLPLGVAVMGEVEGKRLSLDERFTLREEDLSPPYSPIAAAWPARADYSADELLTAAVHDSDNTAADVLMRRIGGPGAITAWLADKDIEEVRIDRYERELQTEFSGMASFRADWRGRDRYLAILNSIPPEARRKAMIAYLSDPRDTATPRGMLTFMFKLHDGELIGAASRAKLGRLLIGGRITTRLQAAMPPGTVLAHKTGSSRTDLGLNGATNDVGVFVLPDKRRYVAAVFLSGSSLGDQARDQAIADLGRAMVKAAGGA